jgi:hypothetical protein
MSKAAKHLIALVYVRQFDWTWNEDAEYALRLIAQNLIAEGL